MKISKVKFVELIAKHLAKKAGTDVSQTDTSLLTASILPLFNAQIEPALKKFNFIDDDCCIDLIGLEEKLLSVFRLLPIFRVPFCSSFIDITEQDVRNFFDEAKKFGFEDTKIIENFTKTGNE